MHPNISSIYLYFSNISGQESNKNKKYTNSMVFSLERLVLRLSAFPLVPAFFTFCFLFIGLCICFPFVHLCCSLFFYLIKKYRFSFLSVSISFRLFIVSFCIFFAPWIKDNLICPTTAHNTRYPCCLHILR